MFFDQKAFTTEECRNWCESWLPNFCFHYTFQTSVSSPGSRLGAERWSSAVWFVVRIKVENTSVNLSEVARETCNSNTFILACLTVFCIVELRKHIEKLLKKYILYTHTHKKNDSTRSETFLSKGIREESRYLTSIKCCELCICTPSWLKSLWSVKFKESVVLILRHSGWKHQPNTSKASVGT